MIKIALTSKDKAEKVLDSIRGIDVIVNKSDYFIRLFFPEKSKDSYPLSPKGALWVSESFIGQVCASIDTVPKKVEEEIEVELEFLTSQEFEERDTEIILNGTTPNNS